MSWNATLGVLRGATLEDLTAAGYVPGDDQIAFEDATSIMNDRIAVMQVGENVLVADAFAELWEVLPAAAEKLGRDGVLLALGGTSDTYVLKTCGSTSRSLVVSQGEVTEDDGTPIPEEVIPDGAPLAASDDMEDAWLDLLERILGRHLGELEDMTFRALES